MLPNILLISNVYNDRDFLTSIVSLKKSKWYVKVKTIKKKINFTPQKKAQRKKKKLKVTFPK